MSDFQLLNPTWLYAIIPAVLLSVWLYRKPKTTSLIANHLSQQLGLDQTKTHSSVVGVLLTAWLIAIVALAGPSFQKQQVPSFGVNNARVIVMDMTLSMYATDLAPNRLTQARYKVMDLLPALKEGTTGLVAYSADGYMISPLTHDANTLKNLIPNLSPDIMPTHGSNAGAGVKKAIDMLTQAGHQQGDIILVADGLSSAASDNIATQLKGTNWNLSVMSVGTAQGAPIRLPSGDMFTHNGVTVVAKADLNALQSLAQTGHGVYTALRTDDVDIQTLAQALNHVELKTNKQNKGSPELEVHINNGFWLLPILLIFALGAFRRGGIFSLALLVSLPLLQPQDAFAAQETQPKTTPESGFELSSVFKTPDQQGYQSYQAKDYAKAATQFESRAWQGTSQYQAGNYQAAIQSLQGLKDEDSRYNLANAQAQAGQLEQAKQGYEDILKTNPNHADAKKNLEIVNKALQQQQNQDDKNNKQDDQQKNDKDSQNQQSKDQQSQDKQDQNSKGNNAQDKSSQSEQSQDSQSQNNQNKSAQDQKQDSQQNQNQSEQSEQDNKDQQNSFQQNSEEKSKQQRAQAQQQAEQSKQKEEQQKQQAMAASEQDKNNPAGNTVAVDPKLNKLEQIPDDARRLLQAQMALEAQQNPQPESNGQQW
ncbi:VWA domain-containing protein [Vibrio sp. CK2-1]|uniref:vWA domain-containing protein n=1 Tax=Vibrio sp. CK2-1 TaxID=2912249 RepID=UPI001F1EF218|nr:VWA domain-containing protein [Vibrio sp. CK2-1]MCF7352668.1 VWA domain-containing protein [Vibrio sp. CK2-1]